MSDAVDYRLLNLGAEGERIRELVFRLADIEKTLDALEADRKELREQLKEFMVQRPETRIQFDRETLNKRKGRETRKISTEKLLALGVKPATVEAATELTVGEPFVVLSHPKENGGGGGGEEGGSA